MKSPKRVILSALICLSCTFFGYVRGSIGGQVAGIAVGIFLSFPGIILISKHEERQKEIREALAIPKIGFGILYWISPMIHYALQAAKR